MTRCEFEGLLFSEEGSAERGGGRKEKKVQYVEKKKNIIVLSSLPKTSALRAVKGLWLIGLYPMWNALSC